MRACRLFVVGVLAVVFCCLIGRHSRCGAAVEGRIKLRVFYAGHPDTDREGDFVGFLKGHFDVVGKGDLAKFKEAQAKGYDVVILDYDGDGFNSPNPRLSRDYSRATVTVGVTGADIGGRRGLKTGYL